MLLRYFEYSIWEFMVPDDMTLPPKWDELYKALANYYFEKISQTY